jgi:hypothetical protein
MRNMRRTFKPMHGLDTYPHCGAAAYAVVGADRDEHLQITPTELGGH